jgi:thiamine-monophosphate kinase
LGIGDDAAILQPDSSKQWVVSSDTLVADVHFKSTDPATSIGHKSLAVNLSDMAAMGAQPKWVLLNLTLPKIDPSWLADFTTGFASLLEQHQVQLVGGDTTQGPLSITVTVMGEVEQAIRRDTAQNDDLIVVTGEIGTAAYALNHPKCKKAIKHHLHQPKPRIDISQQVKTLATAMIDISDGLLADLNHICESSEVGAVIELSQVPVNDVVKKDKNWQQFVVAGGDDYQLCFTMAAKDEEKLPEDCHIIGQIIEGQGIMVLHNHQPIDSNFEGYQHFNDQHNE